MNHEAIRQLPVLVLIVVFGIFLFKHSNSDPELVRRNNLASLARKLKLKFAPGTDFKLAERFSFFAWLNRGDVRSAFNVFHGYYLDFPVTVFDYHFSDYYWSAYIIDMRSNFPDTIISRENAEIRFFEAVGASHITFESMDFSRAFNVRAADKKFAFDICHPKMIEYLLANRDLTIEINRGGLLLLFEDWLRPEKVEFNLSRLIEIRKLLLEYLFTS